MAANTVPDPLDLTLFMALFKKQHKNVLRAIAQRVKSGRPIIAEHARLNFEPVDFIDKNGDTRPMYRLTQRKRDKRVFDERRGALLALLQPSLFGPH